MKICSDICPWTLSVPRSEQFCKNEVKKTANFLDQVMSAQKSPLMFLRSKGGYSIICVFIIHSTSSSFHNAQGFENWGL